MEPRKSPPPAPNQAQMRIQDYLATNKAALDTIVSSLSESLATEHDSDRDRRVIARDTYKALVTAIKSMLKPGFKEGQCWGASGDIAVMIYRPEPGRDLFGRFNVQAGRLDTASMIPCPEDWPTSGATLSPFLERVVGITSMPKSGTRVVTVDEQGIAALGAALGERQYLVESLPGDEMWWRPLDDPAEAHADG